MEKMVFGKRGFLSYFITAGLFAVVAGVVLYASDGRARPPLKKIKPPGSYGTIVMNKFTGEGKKINAVLFPHWIHRMKYTCNVCHTELGFPMKARSTDIKTEDILAGKYCGACHNGKEAFDHSNCKRCHSYGIDVPENHTTEDLLSNLPPSDFGNKVDWVISLNEELINPKTSLKGKGKPEFLDKDIIIPVKKYSPHPPDVLFPHKVHTRWLDCSSCHPKPFKKKKGGNPEMDMMKIISGKYCGKCHGKVSFPLEDCFRCHSQPIEKKKAEKEKGKKKKK